MSLESSLVSALESLVGNRIAPVIFPQPPIKPTWPAIRYIISSVPVVDLCGDGTNASTGEDPTANVRVQLDVVATDYDQAVSLRKQVQKQMVSFSPPATREFSSSEFDDETRTFREILHYSIHGSSS